MDTRTTQTTLPEEKKQKPSKYQKMYDNLMNDDLPFFNSKGKVEPIEMAEEKQT